MPIRDGVDQNTGGDLIGGVVGQHNDGRGMDKRRNDDTSR